MRKKNLKINTDFTTKNDFEILENGEFQKNNQSERIAIKKKNVYITSDGEMELIDYDEKNNDYDSIDIDDSESDYDLDNYEISNTNKVHNLKNTSQYKHRKQQTKFNKMLENKRIIIKYKKRSFVIHKRLHKYLYVITKRLSKHTKTFSCEIKDS
jgi:hypothetical protein